MLADLVTGIPKAKTDQLLTCLAQHFTFEKEKEATKELLLWIQYQLHFTTGKYHEEILI